MNTTSTPPFDTLEAVEARLEMIQLSPVLGITFLDSQGHLVQFFDFDHALKEAIVEYYRERIQQLIRSERAAEQVTRLLAYSTNQD